MTRTRGWSLTSELRLRRSQRRTATGKAPNHSRKGAATSNTRRRKRSNESPLTFAPARATAIWLPGAREARRQNGKSPVAGGANETEGPVRVLACRLDRRMVAVDKERGPVPPEREQKRRHGNLVSSCKRRRNPPRGRASPQRLGRSRTPTHGPRLRRDPAVGDPLPRSPPQTPKARRRRRSRAKAGARPRPRPRQEYRQHRTAPPRHGSPRPRRGHSKSRTSNRRRPQSLAKGARARPNGSAPARKPARK
jgi:hypothetical protein